MDAERASAVLAKLNASNRNTLMAESVGSAASAIRIDRERQSVVGTELTINHLRSLREGRITARAEAVHLGRSTHLWDIRIRDNDDRLIAVARLRMMVLERG